MTAGLGAIAERKVMKWLREIRKVGLRDWLWFVVWLHRNEFSPKLGIERYWGRMYECIRDRDRAHRLDHELGT